MRKLTILVILVAIVAGGSVLYAKLKAPAAHGAFRTGNVKRGDLLITVGATGIVQPEEVVDIGAQVVGRIEKLGADPRSTNEPKFAGKTVDYGSPVEEGMVLALIDKSVYYAQFLQQKASVDRAKADLLQLEAKKMQAEAEWHRAERLRTLKLSASTFTGLRPTDLPTTKLSGKSAGATESTALPIKGISDADFILAQANFEMSKANVEVGKATVEQQAAALSLAETNLSYTVIKSPVSGTIIDRRVNIGQTVVSSMNAPSLFLIAKDLRRMQVWASVNEADIGRLKVDMPVQFTVDAFPNDVFRGQVAQIRLNATMTQNVVTYTVVISAANDDLKLLPYLTSDVKFETENRADVLMVPNAALRFQPKPDQIAKSDDPPHADTADNGKPERDKSERGKGPGKPAKDKSKGTVWIKDGELLSPIAVQVGLTDGVMTEVSSDKLAEDLEVVIGEQRAEAVATTEVNNPLGPPKFPRGGGKKGGGGK